MAGGRQALVEAACELFASQGYAGTTVADVQGAAGLAPGSGALYKHFRSKEELFAACVHQALNDSNEDIASAANLIGPDLRGTLQALVGAGLDRLGQQRPLMRLLFQDGERFPVLRDEFRRGVVQPTYRAFAAWLAGEMEAGRIRSVDPLGTAAVLVGAVVAYRFTEALVGQPPGKVGREAFVEAWTETALALLDPHRDG